MRLFNALGEIGFKKDSHLRDLYFPYGVFGSGFIVETEEQRNKLKKENKRFFLLIFLMSLIRVPIDFFWLKWICFFAFVIWRLLAINSITKELERSSEKLTISEAFQAGGGVFKLPLLIFAEISLLVALAISIVFISGGYGSIIMYVIAVILGLCATLVGYRIFIKLRKS